MGMPWASMNGMSEAVPGLYEVGGEQAQTVYRWSLTSSRCARPAASGSSTWTPLALRDAQRSG